MKKLTLYAIFLLLLQGCSTDEKTSNEITVKQQNLDNFSLNFYPVRSKNLDYGILLSEEQFYDLLLELGVVKDKSDFISQKTELAKTPIQLESPEFSGYRSRIVFKDSCSGNVVSEWLSKIKNDTHFLNLPLTLDTNIVQIDKNCIYYGLLMDSFKLSRVDVSGNYILKK